MNINHGKYLGVDYGDVRTGLAECDISGMLASGITTVREGGMRNTAVRVVEEARSRGCVKIVIGLPRNMDGSRGESARRAEDFAAKLGELTGLPVEMWDERLTTASAIGYLNQTDVRGKKRKQVVDTVAATIILQDFLDSRKG